MPEDEWNAKKAELVREAYARHVDQCEEQTLASMHKRAARALWTPATPVVHIHRAGGDRGSAPHRLISGSFAPHCYLMYRDELRRYVAGSTVGVASSASTGVDGIGALMPGTLAPSMLPNPPAGWVVFSRNRGISRTRVACSKA